MEKTELEEYLKAVDVVCINCVYGDGSECESCLVRKSADFHRNGGRA